MKVKIEIININDDEQRNDFTEKLYEFRMKVIRMRAEEIYQNKNVAPDTD